MRGAYTTPLVTEVDGKSQLIVMGGNQLDAYDPASDKLEKLAKNQIDYDTIASPAISDHRIYLRGHKAIYCLGKDF